MTEKGDHVHKYFTNEALEFTLDEEEEGQQEKVESLGSEEDVEGSRVNKESNANKWNNIMLTINWKLIR